jgi:hypothetical protein
LFWDGRLPVCHLAELIGGLHLFQGIELFIYNWAGLDTYLKILLVDIIARVMC